MPKRFQSKTKEEQRYRNSNESSSEGIKAFSEEKKEKKEESVSKQPSTLRSSKDESYIESVSSSEGLISKEEEIAKQNLLVAILSHDIKSLPKLISIVKNKSINKSINYRDGKDHFTLLHRCTLTQGDPIQIVDMLLEYNAMIDLEDLQGRTPLHLCASRGNESLLNHLLKKGANTMAKTKDNQTPLHLAAEAGHINCVKSLVENHVLVNLQDVEGFTALHLAVNSERVQCVEYLIEHGAAVLSLTMDGKRPIDLIPKLNEKNYSSSGKSIQKLLRKAGGAKVVKATSELIQIGEGNMRNTSNLDSKSARRKSVKLSRSALPAPITARKRSNSMSKCKGEVLKYERSVEIHSIQKQNSMLDISDASIKNDLLFNEDSLLELKLDKFGFVIDEENIPIVKEEQVSSSSSLLSIKSNSKHKKRNIAKETQKAKKWISLMQNTPKGDLSYVNSLRKNKKILKLCDQGIPDTVRGQVWLFLAGVEGRDNSIYHKLLQEGNFVPEIRDQIYRDINRTMPTHILFREKGQGQTMLTNVLLAYSSYRPNVGYCQGMGFITAMFLMYMPEEDAFWLLEQLAGDEFGFGQLWEEEMTYVKQCIKTFSKLLESKFPAIIEKYDENGIPIMAFASQFFITGFMYNLPFGMATRVWDSLWLRKFDYLYAVGLSIMKLSKDRILRAGLERLMSFFQFKERSSIPFTTEQLVETASTIFSKMKLSNLRKIEEEAGDSIKAERELLETRRKKLETLNEDKKIRDIGKETSNTTSDIHAAIEITDTGSHFQTDTDLFENVTADDFSEEGIQKN